MQNSDPKVLPDSHSENFHPFEARTVLYRTEKHTYNAEPSAPDTRKGPTTPFIAQSALKPGTNLIPWNTMNP